MMLAVFTSAIYLLVSSSFALPLKELSPSNDPSFQCGGALTGTIDKVTPIEYKPYEAVASNERCVWTFRAPNATEFDIQVIYQGFPDPDIDSEQRVIVTFINTEWSGAPINHRVLTSGANLTNYMGAALAVTFVSGSNSNNNRGFILTITPRKTVYRMSAAPSSVDYFASSLNGMVRHPAEVADVYGHLDVSLFVYPPLNNTYDPQHRTTITYAKHFAESKECHNHLMILKYNVYSDQPHKYEDAGMICYDTEEDIMTGSDLILIVFRSDYFFYYENTGFHLSYTRCSG